MVSYESAIEFGLHWFGLLLLIKATYLVGEFCYKLAKDREGFNHVVVPWPVFLIGDLFFECHMVLNYKNEKWIESAIFGIGNLI